MATLLVRAVDVVLGTHSLEGRADGPEIIHGPARHPCSTGRQEPAAEGQLDYSGFARRG